VVELEDYLKIYGDMRNPGSIASLLKYSPDDRALKRTVNVSKSRNTGKSNGMAIIGAGNFTKMTMLPALTKSPANITHIVSSGGVSGTALAKKHGIVHSSTDYHEVLTDENVNTVLIATRHNLHASMTIEALQSGKNVFVEKPLCLTDEELEQIASLPAVTRSDGPTVTVGFNRRFSPFAQKMKTLLGNAGTPIHVVATMNAGHIPANAWVHDLKVGGGRIVGEACHFIDLITFLTGSKVVSVCMNALGTQPEENTDNATIYNLPNHFL